MNKLFFIFFSFLIFGCNAKESFIDPIRPEFENVSFDVVQKKLVVDTELPDYVFTTINKWFDQKVKIDGFEGKMTFTVSDYNQEISSINNGKRVDLSLIFVVLLDKSSLSQINLIEGKVSSFGTLTGDFSLNEFDLVIQNAQSDLIIRLSRDLKSKI